jgi:lipopolysaccharide heptosyltransferase I
VRVLIVRLGALGDLVHGLPVAAALRAHEPTARIDWLVDARHAALLDLVPVLDRRVAVDSRSPRGLRAAVGEVRRQRYDVAVDLQGLVKSAALARLSGARRVIGFHTRHLREWPATLFYTERCDPGAAAHVVDKNLALLSAFGLADRRRTFPIDVVTPPAVAAFVEGLDQAGSRGYAILNPGAAWPNKRWPAERFGEVGAWLAAHHHVTPVVAWGPGEEALAGRVARASGGAAVPAPPTGVGDLIALARGARIVVSGDTGPLHLAAAVGAPIVALFGPTNPARNGPWDGADITLSRYGECVCHYQRRCRRSRACIEDLSVEDVRGAIDRRLAAVASAA